MKKRYVGVDLHRNCFTACYRDEEGLRQKLSDFKAQMDSFLEEFDRTK